MSLKEEELKAERDLLFQLAQNNVLRGLRSFPKFQRLLTKPDFNLLKRESKRFHSQGIIVFYRIPNGLEYSRLGIAVTKKTGSAVMRNKLKRAIREDFRNSALKKYPVDFLVTINNRVFKSISSHKEQRESIRKGLNDFLSFISDL